MINLVAIGLARFLSQVWFGAGHPVATWGPKLSPVDIPLLSDLPWGLGRAFQQLSPMVIVAFLLLIPVWYSLNRTRWACGCAHAARTPRRPARWASRSPSLPLPGRAALRRLAGLAGRSSIEESQFWREGQTQGLGFIALAALILSNWNPVRLLWAAFLFGFAQAIPLRLDDFFLFSWPLPQFIRMIPYIVTPIVAIAGSSGRCVRRRRRVAPYEGGGAL